MREAAHAAGASCGVADFQAVIRQLLRGPFFHASCLSQVSLYHNLCAKLTACAHDSLPHMPVYTKVFLPAVEAPANAGDPQR